MSEAKFSAREIGRRFGATERQLGWWRSRGVLRAPRRSSYAPVEALAAAVAIDLRRKGLMLRHIREILERAETLLTKALAGRETYLVVVGRRVVRFSDSRQMIAWIAGVKGAAVVCDVSDLARKLAAPEEKAERVHRTKRAAAGSGSVWMGGAAL